MLFPMLLAAMLPQTMTGMNSAEATCTTSPVPLPKELRGWRAGRPVSSGRDAARAPSLALGSGVTATLLPLPQISYAVRPERLGGPSSNGGLFAFSAPTAGRYRVALGTGVWIDVVRDDVIVASASHGHGPDCSGVRKTVDFDLKPGRHILEVAGATSAVVRLMIVRLP